MKMSGDGDKEARRNVSGRSYILLGICIHRGPRAIYIGNAEHCGRAGANPLQQKYLPGVYAHAQLLMSATPPHLSDYSYTRAFPPRQCMRLQSSPSVYITQYGSTVYIGMAMCPDNIKGACIVHVTDKEKHCGRRNLVRG